MRTHIKLVVCCFEPRTVKTVSLLTSTYCEDYIYIERVLTTLMPRQHVFINGKCTAINLVIYIDQLTKWLEDGL